MTEGKAGHTGHELGCTAIRKESSERAQLGRKTEGRSSSSQRSQCNYGDEGMQNPKP